MKKQRYFDISVGLFMLLGMVSLLVMVMKVSGLSNIVTNDTYTVSADFTDIGGLRVRAPVTVAGVQLAKPC